MKKISILESIGYAILIYVIISYTMMRLFLLVGIDYYNGNWMEISTLILVGLCTPLLWLRYKKAYPMQSEKLSFDGIGGVIVVRMLLFALLAWIAINLLESMVSIPSIVTFLNRVPVTATNSILKIVSCVIAAPVLEELVFRGFVYKSCRQKFGFAWSALISSLLWGFMHGSLEQAITVALFGLVLAFAYEKCGRLWVPISMHMLFNIMSIYFMPSGGVPMLAISIVLIGYIIYKSKNLLQI